MRDRHGNDVDPIALALLGLAFFTFAVFGTAYFANLREPDLLREEPWLVILLTFGGLAFLWGFVLLLTDYPEVQSMAFDLLTVVSFLVAPMVLLCAVAVATASGGGGD